jgi:sulfite exporter TauE/SafE/copper chaperone CopZ
MKKEINDKKDAGENKKFYVQGMHCASCEVLIEKKLLREKGIKAADASTRSKEVLIAYKGKTPSVKKLNELFRDDHYFFSEKPSQDLNRTPFISVNKGGEIVLNKTRLTDLLFITGIALLVIIGFLFLHNSGLSSVLNINEKSTLPAFFIFGLLAGTSTCAALVGGLVLSMSKQWSEIYAKENSMFKRMEPNLLFNGGRIVSYAVLGGVLGALGGVLKISLTVSSVFTLGIAVMMIFLAFQMLGVKAFQGFQLKPPKLLSRYIADESNFKGKYMPFIMGALTFFLPCGFTITAQGLALTSGSAIQGSLIMLFFVLGTLPVLFFIGVSSTKLMEKPHISDKFLKIAGILVLFFALFTANAQLTVLGLPNLDDLQLSKPNSIVAHEETKDLPSIVDGKQVIKMDASASGYSPNYFKVRVNIPVRWEITDKGVNGCTNAVISQALFDGSISLKNGETSVKEFTPTKVGKYKFSCWMGMVTGVIEVI